MFASEVNNDVKTGQIYSAHCPHKLTVKKVSILRLRGIDKLQIIVERERERESLKQTKSASRKSVSLWWVYIRNGCLELSSLLISEIHGNLNEEISYLLINEGPHYTVLGKIPSFLKEISLGYSRKYCHIAIRSLILLLGTRRG